MTQRALSLPGCCLFPRAVAVLACLCIRIYLSVSHELGVGDQRNDLAEDETAWSMEQILRCFQVPLLWTVDPAVGAAARTNPRSPLGISFSSAQTACAFFTMDQMEIFDVFSGGFQLALASSGRRRGRSLRPRWHIAIDASSFIVLQPIFAFVGVAVLSSVVLV